MNAVWCKYSFTTSLNWTCKFCQRVNCCHLCSVIPPHTLIQYLNETHWGLDSVTSVALWEKVMLRSAEEALSYQSLSERVWDDWPPAWLMRITRGRELMQTATGICVLSRVDPCEWRLCSVRAVGGVEAVMWCVSDSLAECENSRVR